MPVLAPLLIGALAAKFGGRILRPVWQTMVKATVVVAAEAKKTAAAMKEDIQDISAEVGTERAADEATRGTRTGEGATRGARTGEESARGTRTDVVSTKETKTGPITSRGADVTR